MKTKVQKNQIIERLAENINKYPCLIFADYHGLTVSEVDILRGQIARISRSYDDPDFKFEVVKNNLLTHALKKTQYSELLNSLNLKGPMAVLWSRNIIDASKTVAAFAKDHQNLKLKFGISDGKFVSDKEVITISQLPPKEVLVGKLLGLLNSPIVNLVNVINAPVKSLVLILNQKANIRASEQQSSS